MEKSWKHQLLSWVVVVSVLLAALSLFGDKAFAQGFFTDCASNTGENATVVIPDTAPEMHIEPGVTYTPQPGDEFAVFRPNPDGEPSPDDLCAGWVAWDGQNTSLTVWGNDAQTPETDGMLPGEVMQWRVWDHENNLQYAAEVQYVSDAPFWPNGEYGANRFYQLQSIAPTVVGLNWISAQGSRPGWLGSFLFGLFVLISAAIFFQRWVAVPKKSL